MSATPTFGALDDATLKALRSDRLSRIDRLNGCIEPHQRYETLRDAIREETRRLRLDVDEADRELVKRASRRIGDSAAAAIHLDDAGLADALRDLNPPYTANAGRLVNAKGQLVGLLTPAECGHTIASILNSAERLRRAVIADATRIEKLRQGAPVEKVWTDRETEMAETDTDRTERRAA